MKCVDAVLVPVRLQGIQILNCIDDWLILDQTEQLAVWYRDVILKHIQRDSFWPVVHDTIAVVARNQRILLKGKSAPQVQGHMAMPLCLGHVA